MTNSDYINFASIVEEKVGTLAALIHDGWQGDVWEICTDYAYLLSKGGKVELLDKFIAEFRERLEEDDEEE